MKYIMQNSKSNYNLVIDSIIENRKKEIFEFFNCSEIELSFNIYVYDSIEELVKGLAKRGFKKDPSYMCACHKDEDNSLNFFEPKDNPSATEWSKKEYEMVIFHELIHGIQSALFGTIPEWLSEGIAKYLDGTYSKGIKWLLDNYINNNSIPEQDEIENEFGMHDYDSYDYAYLMVSYLIETLGKDNFVNLLRNKEQIEIIKEDLLYKAIDYFNKKYTEEEIKSLLIEIKDNPKKLLDLRKYSSLEVVEVAFKYKLYEPLMIAFQPISIDGEIIIGLDAFSSDILPILYKSCDTIEQAEQEARQEYEEIQEYNSKLSEKDREWLYDSTTYEDILNTKTIIPKEIKEAFKKIMYEIDYEKISKIKIKNCHARQIGGWGYQIKTVGDVIMYSELPCLKASIDLFNKNIRTTMNDTECVFEEPSNSNGICTIWIDYSSLTEENKNIVEELILTGNAKRFMDGTLETIEIFVPCSREETVDEISDKLMRIVSKLKVQDIKYDSETTKENNPSDVQTL